MENFVPGNVVPHRTAGIRTLVDGDEVMRRLVCRLLNRHPTEATHDPAIVILSD